MKHIEVQYQYIWEIIIAMNIDLLYMQINWQMVDSFHWSHWNVGNFEWAWIYNCLKYWLERSKEKNFDPSSPVVVRCNWAWRCLLRIKLNYVPHVNMCCGFTKMHQSCTCLLLPYDLFLVIMNNYYCHIFHKQLMRQRIEYIPFPYNLTPSERTLYIKHPSYIL